MPPSEPPPKIRLRGQSPRSEREHLSGKRLVKGVMRAFSARLPRGRGSSISALRRSDERYDRDGITEAEDAGP